MKRPKRFLSLILILLVINTAFFIAWYGFDLPGKIKDIAVRELGKALGGKANLKELSVGEKQILAKDLSFTARDGSLRFRIEHIRVRYNLLKLIFTGFKLKNLLDKVEIVNPEVTLNIVPRVKEKKFKAHKEFKLPDVSRYFHQLDLKNGTFDFKGQFPLKIINHGNLDLSEKLTNINISAVNTRKTEIDLRANSSSGGLIKAQASLDKGRLAFSTIDISNLSPEYANHPDVRDFHTELNIALTASQATAESQILFDGQAFIWNTGANFLDKYQVLIPYVSVSYNGNDLITDMTTASIGSSSLSANVHLEGLNSEPTISGTAQLEAIDLAMADPSLKGIVTAQVTAEGSLKDPVLKLKADSDNVRYGDITVSAIAMEAEYADDMVTYDLTKARWDNQTFSTQGIADLKLRQLTGTMQTVPIELYGKELVASGKIDYTASLYEKLPEITVALNDVSLVYGLLELSGVNGNATLIPSTDQNGSQSYFVNSTLKSDQGYDLTLIGDVLDKNLLLDMSFSDSSLEDIYALQMFTDYRPVLNGTLKAIMSNGSITTRSDLNLALGKDFSFHSDLRILGNYDLDTGDAALHLNGSNGVFNDEPVDVQLSAQKQGSYISVNSLRIGELLSLTGKADTRDLRDMTFDLALTDVSSQTIRHFYPSFDPGIPEFSGLSIVANVSNDPERFIDARINLREFLVEGIYPLSAKIRLIGPPEECLLTGDISNSTRNLVRLSGEADIGDKVQVKANARVENLEPEDIIFSSPVSGSISGIVSAEYTDFLGMITKPVLKADVHLKDLKASGVDVDQIDLVAQQTGTAFKLETLSASEPGMFTLSGSGALDYNILTNQFFEGTNTIKLDIQGELFAWLDDLVDYITDSGGKSSLTCNIGTLDEQLTVSTGSLQIKDGFVKLKDQAEQIKNINISGQFSNNRLILDNAEMTMGEGKLVLANQFREDISNHFQIGFLDLGVFELSIDDPGVLVNIPLFTPPRSLSNVSLKGQNKQTATVMGPFDDMKISAHATVSNASAVYPPNTDNLLKLIYTVRDAVTKTTREEPVPLPFRLDLLITLQDNVSYVTYPTNFIINPGSFLRLIYDGNTWSLNEANFTSESGTIDFFGTVFENQSLDVYILESRNVMQISGDFIKRAPDGTTVTLKVGTDKDNTKSLMNRLQFNLTSDNPEDQSITSVLSRLRYNQTEDELSSGQKQNLLSDDALNLVGGNLNSSLLTPILYPIENSIRRFLRLDTFSIRAGFIQNLFTEYSSDPQKIADFADLRQFNNDVMQFSSSILLNNLSLSMSKYIGHRLFLDYRLTLQEATDLQKNTIVLVAHDTSLRYILPYKFRISYNLKYEPEEATFTHGIMLKRSFVFTGL